MLLHYNSQNVWLFQQDKVTVNNSRVGKNKQMQKFVTSSNVYL